MKQFTSIEQTAKLIELGVDRPMSEGVRSVTDTMLEFYPAYSIGELIEMLPKTITREIRWGGYKGKKGVWGLHIEACETEYCCVVSYERELSVDLYLRSNIELIDALYDMAILLKKEGVI